MKIKIKKYKLEKIEIDSMDFEMPEEPCYFFETNIRRSIRIVPKYTTWNKEQYDKEEEIYEFDITCVYLSFECKIEKFSINVSDLENTNHKGKDFITSWINGWFNIRTKEQFYADLTEAIEKINKIDCK